MRERTARRHDQRRTLRKHRTAMAQQQRREFDKKKTGVFDHRTRQTVHPGKKGRQTPLQVADPFRKLGYAGFVNRWREDAHQRLKLWKKRMKLHRSRFSS